MAVQRPSVYPSSVTAVDRMEQWSRYVRATGIDEMFVGEEWEDYLSTQVYYGVVTRQLCLLGIPSLAVPRLGSCAPTLSAPHCAQPLPTATASRVLEL